jgi:ribosome recycling factor
LKSFQDEKLISEDEFYRGRDEVQTLTDDYVKQADEIGERKEAEIREV